MNVRLFLTTAFASALSASSLYGCGSEKKIDKGEGTDGKNVITFGDTLPSGEDQKSTNAHADKKK